MIALVLFHMSGLAGSGSAERKGQLGPQFLGYGEEGGVGSDLRKSSLLWAGKSHSWLGSPTVPRRAGYQERFC